MKFESKFNVGDKVIAKDSLDGIVKSISFDGNKFTYLIAADYSSVCSMQFYNEEDLKIRPKPDIIYFGKIENIKNVKEVNSIKINLKVGWFDNIKITFDSNGNFKKIEEYESYMNKG